jgi:hypothetical protein
VEGADRGIRHRNLSGGSKKRTKTSASIASPPADFRSWDLSNKSC